MNVVPTRAFIRCARALPDDDRTSLFDAVLGLPGLLGDPHRHGGAGLRKIHPRGIFQVRVGPKLRLIFVLRTDTVTLDFVGTHDEVARYLNRF